MDRDELAAWLRLTLTPGIGAASGRRLLAAFGLPQQVFGAPDRTLVEVLGPRLAQAIRVPPSGLAESLATTARWLDEAPDRRVLSLADAAYPLDLLQSADPPLLLYAQGAPLRAGGAFAWPEAIAIVGSRNPTAQGQGNARAFARSLAGAGLCVVSGLAQGIDAAAHEGALEAALDRGETDWATIAVVGTGLDRVYPARHQGLARRIAQHGLVLGEYPLGTPPLAQNFPRRNRLIAGLARGTLVVEAAPQSGSLITARCAVEQGREVFALPGSIHSPQSRGCHALIRQGAALVETAQDILDEIAPRPSSGRAATQPAPPLKSTQGDEDPLLRALGYEPATLDALIDRTGLPTPALQARLLEMELAGEVARLPGGLFQRLAHT